MPAYSSTGNRVSLANPLDSQVVWNAESPATNAASQQVALGQGQAGDSMSASIEIHFSADPGVFSITVQTADTDVDGAYTAYAGASPITAVNAGFYASLMLTDLRCNFMRLFMTNDPANSVTTTAMVTR